MDMYILVLIPVPNLKSHIIHIHTCVQSIWVFSINIETGSDTLHLTMKIRLRNNIKK